MEKQVTFAPAYDKRNPDPHKNYGVHGVNLRFLLKGELGATQFVIYTNWHLPEVQREITARALGDMMRTEMLLPLPADVGYHSPKPMYDGQSSTTDSCEYLNGKTCYYDGSGLYAEKVYVRLLREGDTAVWEVLEEEYIRRFGELK